MKIHITILSLILLLLAACSDEFGLPNERGIQSDGTVELTFSVPAAAVVNTRAEADPEYQVNDISILVFKGSDSETAPAQIIEKLSEGNLIYLNDNRYKVSFKLNADIRSSKDLQFYFIANIPENVTFQVNTTLSTILKQESNSIGESGKFVMSGYCSLSDLTTKDIPLYRNGTKVTVTNATNSQGATTEPGSESYLFSLFGNATSSPVIGGFLSAEGSDEGCGAPSVVSDFPNDITDNGIRYYHPTLNTGSNEGKAFIIVKAEYETKSYFYRLDFKRIEEATNEGATKEKEVYLDLLPNHWYQVMIESIDGPGYTSPEEASKHPISLITYDIHDHAPVIFNMISDGIRELGVTHEVTYNNGVIEDEKWSEKYIDIKCFSKYDSEMTSLPEGLTIISEDEWLEISDPEEITNDDLIGTGSESDTNHTGKVFRYKLRFKETAELGTLNSDITVAWKGLTCKIPVTWERSFSGSGLCNVTLKIFNEENELKETITDYWGFLASKEEGSNYSKAGLWGISPSKNNGKIRNQGLHFPVMYGDPGEDHNVIKRWYYEYEVEMTALEDYDFKWEVKIDGDPTIKDYVTVDGSTSGDHSAGDPFKFKINRVGNACDNLGTVDGVKNDYEYGTGKFILIVTPTKREDEPNSRLSNEYSFDLYHTGFFHHPKFSYKNGETIPSEILNDDFYYYEVVPIQGAVRMRYWLDRNLGAKSSGMYIEATGGTPYYGDADAAGGYYKVANYNKYNDPTMITTIAPPGYRVPQQKVWDAMRNSKRFHTEVSGNHFESYYETTNPEVGKVYFPKAMMMVNGEKIGESRAGYYWTRTASTGTEKEEIGKWLKMLMISGSSTSYINGDVTSYQASVRCINDIPDNNILKRTSFNVNGATHVYLYKKNSDGTKVATTTWPGHVIGNYSTMKDGWFNFAYESNDFDPSELYVIFNFVDENGIIHTICKETIKDPSKQYSIKPSEATGWKVINDNCENTRSEFSWYKLTNPSTLGCWWSCQLEDASVKVSCMQPGTSKPMSQGRKYRIYWKKSLNVSPRNYSYIWTNRLSNVLHTGEENGFFYYDMEDFSGNVSFHFYDKNADKIYQSSGEKDWNIDPNDFTMIDGYGYYFVIQYNIAGGGIPYNY